MHDRKMRDRYVQDGKCRTKNGVENAGPANAGPSSLCEVTWKKRKNKLNVMLQCTGRCCSSFRIQLIIRLLIELYAALGVYIATVSHSER